MKYYRINTEQKQPDGSWKQINDELVEASSFKRAEDKLRRKLEKKLGSRKMQDLIVCWNGED